MIEVRRTEAFVAWLDGLRDERAQDLQRPAGHASRRSESTLAIDARIAEQEGERSRMRKTQVGTGDRSAKIRTYNFPQNRVTDHRIGFTMHELTKVLDGEIEPVIEALRGADIEDRLGE